MIFLPIKSLLSCHYLVMVSLVQYVTTVSSLSHSRLLIFVTTVSSFIHHCLLISLFQCLSLSHYYIEIISLLYCDYLIIIWLLSCLKTPLSRFIVFLFRISYVVIVRCYLIIISLGKLVLSASFQATSTH